jgi:Na+/H+ antiporter NhaC
MKKKEMDICFSSREIDHCGYRPYFIGVPGIFYYNANIKELNKSSTPRFRTYSSSSSSSSASSNVTNVFSLPVILYTFCLFTKNNVFHSIEMVFLFLSVAWIRLGLYTNAKDEL